jgi:AcrR family transcriptional regulator
MNNGTTPKERLFQTAARLFYQHGYRAVGVDAIAANRHWKDDAVRHYPSKDDDRRFHDKATRILGVFRAEYKRGADGG